MIERDARIAELLDRLQPAFAGESGDWGRVVRDSAAERRTSRRSIVVLVALAVAAVAVVVPAVAVKGWWFLGAGSPMPAGEVGVVTTLHADGGSWKLTAYVSESDGLCVGLTPEQPGDSGAESCGSGIRGEPNLSQAKAPVRHFVGYVSDGTVIFGPTASDVARVDVELDDGRTVETTTLRAPEAVHTSLRFYVARLPTGTTATALVARDETGLVLERLRLRR